MLKHWQCFEAKFRQPAAFGGPFDYSRLSAELDLASEQQAYSLVQTVKRAFTRHLHEAVAQTVEDPADVPGEVERLLNVLAK